MHWVHPRLSLGAEFNPGVAELGPLVSAILLTESVRRPALSAGTSSDRIGTPEGTTSIFLTAAKRSSNARIPVSVYASLNWSEYDDGFNLPFGGTLHVGEDWVLRGMYDGRRTHLLVGFTHDRWTWTALLVRFEHLGLAISTGWGE